MNASIASIENAAKSPDGAADSGSLAERVRAILPQLEALVPEGEKQRKAPEEQLRLFTEVGFWRHFVPKCYGGSEGGVYDWIQAVRLVGSVDMSAAWTAGLASCHSPPYTYFDERVQDEMWGETPDIKTGTAGAPPAAAKRVDGGVILNGRMNFSSGCDHVDWLLTYFVEPDEDGIPQRIGALMPKGDYRIEDTWHVSGMRATGSNTVVIEELFVPEYRLSPFPVGKAGPIRRTNGAPLYRLSHWALFGAAFAPLIVGGMERALEIVRDAMKKKVSAATGKTGMDSVSAQMRYAQCRLKADAAIALAENRWREMDEQSLAGEVETIEDFHRWKAIHHHVAEEAVKVVETLMNSASPSSHYNNYPLQRFWRDIHVASRHPFLEIDSSLQAFARHELGMPRNIEMMFG